MTGSHQADFHGQRADRMELLEGRDFDGYFEMCDEHRRERVAELARLLELADEYGVVAIADAPHAGRGETMYLCRDFPRFPGSHALICYDDRLMDWGARAEDGIGNVCLYERPGDAGRHAPGWDAAVWDARVEGVDDLDRRLSPEGWRVSWDERTRAVAGTNGVMPEDEVNDARMCANLAVREGSPDRQAPGSTYGTWYHGGDASR